MIYRPSMVAHLRMAFDPALLAIVGGAAAEVLPTSRRLQPILAPDQRDIVSQRLNVQARDGLLELPGFRQAGTFNLTLSFRDFPLDPRVLRACEVEIHLGVVSDIDFASGVDGARQGGRAKGPLLSVLDTSVQPRPGDPASDTRRMVGFADEVAVEHGPDGSWVTLEGRDLRGILIDSPIPAKDKDGSAVLSQIELRKPIDQVVLDLLKLHPLHPALGDPLGQNLVVANAGEWEGGVIPSPATQGGRTAVRRAVRDDKPRASQAADKFTYWDAITRYCFMVGAVPYFKGRQLIIQPARAIGLDVAFNPYVPTPFRDGLPRGYGMQGGPFGLLSGNVRRLFYGRDLERVSFKRKLGGGVKLPVVRVVCIDTSSARRGVDGKFLEASYPSKADGDAKVAASTDLSPDGQQGKQQVLTIPVHGYRDLDKLRSLARDLHEEIGRGEMGGSAETKELTSFGGDASDPDLLRLSPGDSVQIQVDASSLTSVPPVMSELQALSRVPDAEAIKIVAELLGGDENLARVMVGTARGRIVQLQDVFRTNTVRYTYSKGAIGIKFDFSNYAGVAFDDAAGRAEVQSKQRPKAAS